MVTTEEKIQGTTNTAVVNVAASATDAAGDTFVTGAFSGSVNFGGTTLTSSGNMDQQAFVAKYNSNGSLAWVHALAGNAGNSAYSDRGSAIAVSSDGSKLYLGGTYYSSLQLDGRHSISGPSSSNASFIAQYDGSGNVNWVMNAAGSATGAHATIYDLAIDSAGNAYAAASYDSSSSGSNPTVILTPASGGTVDLGHTAQDGNAQGAILKLTSAGAISWIAKTDDVNGTTGGVNDIAVDGTGNVYVTGTSYNTQFINADGSVSTTSTGSSGFPGSFVAQLNSAGQYQWVNNIAEPGTYGGYFGFTDVAVDQAGVVVTGAYMDNTVIGGQTLHAHTSSHGSGSYTYHYSASRAFVEQLDSSGNSVWLKTESDNGTLASDGATNVTVDAAGNIVVAGVINGGGNDSFGGKSVASPTGRDGAFIWDLSSSGTTQSAGGFSNASGNISVGGLFGASGGGVALALNLNKQTDADPGPATLNVDTGNVGASPFILLSGADLNETHAAPRDFDANGKSDLLWRDSATGQLSIWQTPGTSSVNLGAALSSTVTVIGTGDFNGDGKADILLQDSVTGQISNRLVNGGTVISGGGKIGDALPAWKAAAIGDFNGDGKSDVVVQNSSSGNVSIYTVNGGAKLATVKVGSAAGWQVIATGDFNGDGQTDILLRNTSNAKIDIWFMNGTTKLSTGSVGAVPAGWSVVATGDFNGDGKTDIVTQNTTSSNIKIWFMDGATKTSTGTTNTPGGGWSVTGSGDFNGDGISDLVMQNSNGHAQVWYMSGSTTLPGSGILGNARGANFHLIAG